jgi:hypothetical protein
MLRIKVCGMNHPENIREIAALEPEFLGLIFYSGSPRNALRLHTSALREIGPATRLTGVFVNETPYNIRKTAAVITSPNFSSTARKARQPARLWNRTVLQSSGLPRGESSDLEAIRTLRRLLFLRTYSIPGAIYPEVRDRLLTGRCLRHMMFLCPFFWRRHRPRSISALKEIPSTVVCRGPE